MIRSTLLTLDPAAQERFHLLIGFVSTRTMLIRAEWNGRDLLENERRAASESRAASGEFGRLAVTWPDGIAAGEEVAIELFYLGEEPRVLFAEWDVAGAVEAPRSAPSAAVRRLPLPEPLSQRDEPAPRRAPMPIATPTGRAPVETPEVSGAVAEDLVQQRKFFTELNDRSLPAYMRIAGLQPSVIARREAMFEGLHPYLTHRLWQTFQWTPGTPEPDLLAVPSREWVVEFAVVFWGSIESAYGEQGAPLDSAFLNSIGIALDRFAGGMLRHPVSDEEIREKNIPDRWHNDTDSFFVYFFAEFALVAIEHGVDADRFAALLPRLVRMQKFFNGRYAISKRGVEVPTIDRVGTFTRYMQPPLHALTFAQYARLSALPAPGAMADLRGEVRENLHEIAERFGPRTPPRA